MLRYQPPLTDEELRAAWIFDGESAMELEAADEGAAAATAAAETADGGGHAAGGEARRGRRRRKRRRADEDETGGVLDPEAGRTLHATSPNIRSQTRSQKAAVAVS